MVGLDRALWKDCVADKKVGSSRRKLDRRPSHGAYRGVAVRSQIMAGERTSRRMIVTIYSKEVIKVAVAREDRVSCARAASADAGAKVK